MIFDVKRDFVEDRTRKKLNQKKDLDFMVKLIKEKNHVIFNIILYST